MSISVVWGAGVKEDSEKFSEKKEFLSVTDYGGAVAVADAAKPTGSAEAAQASCLAYASTVVRRSDCDALPFSWLFAEVENSKLQRY